MLRNLGKGSYGKVMLVQHTVSLKLYAMKVLIKKAVKNLTQKTHVQTERKILEITNHNFITKLHYAFQSQTKLYLIMEFVSGGELFYHMKLKGRMTEKNEVLCCRNPNWIGLSTSTEYHLQRFETRKYLIRFRRAYQIM